MPELDNFYNNPLHMVLLFKSNDDEDRFKKTALFAKKLIDKE